MTNAEPITPSSLGSLVSLGSLSSLERASTVIPVLQAPQPSALGLGRKIFPQLEIYSFNRSRGKCTAVTAATLCSARILDHSRLLGAAVDVAVSELDCAYFERVHTLQIRWSLSHFYSAFRLPLMGVQGVVAAGQRAVASFHI